MVKATEWKSFDEWLGAALNATFMPGPHDPRLLVGSKEPANLTEDEIKAMEEMGR